MTSKTIILAVAAFVAGGSSVFAENDPGNFYFHTDAGVAFVQNVTLHAGNSSAEVKFDTGTRVDLAFGYNFNNCLAAELETGMVWNRVSGTGFLQVPLLVNGIYKVDLKNRWTPYFGLGVGIDYSVLNNDFLFPFLTEDVTAPNSVTFAYQAQAGIDYSLTPKASIDFGYKFLGTVDHPWNLDNARVNSALYTHALLLSFSVKF